MHRAAALTTRAPILRDKTRALFAGDDCGNFCYVLASIFLSYFLCVFEVRCTISVTRDGVEFFAGVSWSLVVRGSGNIHLAVEAFGAENFTEIEPPHHNGETRDTQNMTHSPHCDTCKMSPMLCHWVQMYLCLFFCLKF